MTPACGSWGSCGACELLGGLRGRMGAVSGGSGGGISGGSEMVRRYVSLILIIRVRRLSGGFLSVVVFKNGLLPPGRVWSSSACWMILQFFFFFLFCST